MKLFFTISALLYSCLAFPQNNHPFIGKPLVNVKCELHCCFIENSLRIDSNNRFCSYSQGISYIYRYGNWQYLTDTSIRLTLPYKSTNVFSIPQMMESRTSNDSTYSIKYSIANRKPSKMIMLGIDTILVSNDSAEFQFDSLPEFWQLRQLVSNGDTIGLLNPVCFGFARNENNHHIIHLGEPIIEVEFVYDLIKLPNGIYILIERKSQKKVTTYVRLEDYFDWSKGNFLNGE